jgi:ATP-dependent Clp protease ATP-binding subunit ClpA
VPTGRSAGWPAAALRRVLRSRRGVPDWIPEVVMFERFTDRARRVLVLAQEEARLLNHNFIGTEHILLGLIHEGDGVAAQTLAMVGISLEAVRLRVSETIGPAGHSSHPGSPPFTPRAKKVLELSLREALQLGHNYIGTEHMLLGLLREGEGVGAQVLVDLGADLYVVRQQVIQLLSGPGALGAGGGGFHTASSASSRSARGAPASIRTPGAMQVDSAARRLAADLPVGTQHILIGLFEQPDSLAAKVLASLNIDRSAVEQLVADLGVKDTSDELPEVTGGRKVLLRVVEDRVVVEVDDPDLADLVRRGLVGQAGDGEQSLGSAGGDGSPSGDFSGIWTAINAAAADLIRRSSTAQAGNEAGSGDPPPESSIGR